jgi:bla regulator protein blaR1
VTVDACLAGYGLGMAMVAPRLLARQTAPGHAPRLAVAAWLAAAAAVLGAWLGAAISLADHPGAVARGVGVALLVGLPTRVLWVCAVIWWVTRSRRMSHIQAAALLGRRDADLGVIVVDSREPAAYCVPTLRGGVVVVTTAARSALSPRQLRAVLAHEHAHLRGHHHLLISLGQAMSRAIPALPLFRQLGVELTRLLEMRADDAAAKLHGRRTVATAIAAMGARPSPAGTLGAGGPAALQRALRLTQPNTATPLRRIALAATATAVAASPYLATLAPCPHPW